LSHTNRAAELCRNWSFCPAVVDTIIFQHHERPDGRGFPMGKVASELHPLSCLFIMSEDFVNYFIDHRSTADIGNFIATRADIYSGPEMGKIFEAFSRLLLKRNQTAS